MAFVLIEVYGVTKEQKSVSNHRWKHFLHVWNLQSLSSDSNSDQTINQEDEVPTEHLESLGKMAKKMTSSAAKILKDAIKNEYRRKNKIISSDSSSFQMESVSELSSS